ncbi:MAG TPA: tRNA (N(6)-L-threonylcarbamoyladenosine(37)-C(2))-methylthiotransferase MtaB [Candidatus Sphingobacterium stercoripullorum]|nr:tRNA (N(6)-L-threonylcarbamoyladenosine(37)-C(2))-methylthiotransferase MtaB [Candidatus Sphingobacterium stercoripullorum]
MKRKVAFYTLGCKLNFSETSSIGRLFTNEGFEVVPFGEPADYFVINTCSVTEHADRKCKRIVRDAKKISPNSRVVIVGCYAQLKPKEIAEIPGVDAVFGAAEKFNIIEHIEKLEDKDVPLVLNEPIENTKDFISAFSFGDRTRTFLKVQDGCDYSCTFCTIPLARGNSRSGEIDVIVKQAEEIAASGVKEIVLTGVNIGDFGIRDGKRQDRFIDLLKELDKVEGIDRIRISSIEPNLLTNEIIQFVASSTKFVPHFHMPLQSGSNSILAQMRRRYKRELYAERVQQIHDLMPNCCIGVDVIVGFPGETKEHFLETYEFLNQLNISYLHVFTYSERENTIAAQMSGAIPNNLRSDRSKMLHSLSEKKRRSFYESQLGRSEYALLENNVKDGYMTGFTRNYVKIRVPYDESYVNQIVNVDLLDIEPTGEVNVKINQESFVS